MRGEFEKNKVLIRTMEGKKRKKNLRKKDKYLFLGIKPER
jgi:hypothetical protein